MSGDAYQVDPDQLDQLAKQWRTSGEQLQQVSKKIEGLLGQFHTAELQTLLTKGFVAAELVVAAQEATEKVGQSVGKTSQSVGTDATNVEHTAKNYRDAEEHAKGGFGDKGGTRHHGGVRPPHHPGGHPGHHPGGDPGHQPGGDPGHNAPVGKVVQAGAIPVGEVTYGGKGSFPGGKAACEEAINKALDAKGITDPTARANWMKGMLTIAERESAYNIPQYQVNTTDVNAVGAKAPDGYPGQSSRGGWQCIPSTFAEHHQPGTSNDIYDPVANCAASMNYIMDRYHVSPDGSNLAAKVQQADPNRNPRGY